MLDPKLLRKETDAVFAKLARRGKDYDKKRYLDLEQERVGFQTRLEMKQSLANKQSRGIAKIKKDIELLKVPSREIALLKKLYEDDSQKADILKSEVAELQTLWREQQAKINGFLQELPNIPDESVPDGTDETDNQELRRWHQPPNFDFDPLDHVDIATRAGWLDTDAAAVISGARYMVLHGELAQLHQALIRYMLDLHVKRHGYRQVYVPYIVNADALFGTGQLPKFEQDLFKLQGDGNFYLIPTAEVPVTNLHRDTILKAEQLPIRYVCHTPCFRSEAGAYGKDTRGLMRQHQFEKVELVHIVKPEDSWDTLETLVSHAEAVLQSLGLHYRVVVLCCGDLGFASAKTYDIEVWVPSENRYREISSCSNMTDFQARRMKTRMRNAEGKTEYVHTLNGSGLAVGRTLLALLENYQRADGSVAIPKALQPYMDGKSVIGTTT